MTPFNDLGLMNSVLNLPKQHVHSSSIRTIVEEHQPAMWWIIKNKLKTRLDLKPCRKIYFLKAMQNLSTKKLTETSFSGVPEKGAAGRLPPCANVRVARFPFSLTCVFENYIMDCFKVHSYCQCIITTVIDGFPGWCKGCDSPRILWPHSINSAICSYHSVNSGIYLHHVVGFLLEVQCAGWKDRS